jgi:hypothetical protein
VWSDEERAYFILINSMTKEDYDSGLPEVLAMGIDPAKIDGLEPNYRDTLPTRAEWDAEIRRAVAARDQAQNA